MTASLTRRDFLKIGSASAIGLFLSACGPKDILTLTPLPTPGKSIVQPQVIASSNGLLDTQLLVMLRRFTLPGKTAPSNLRTYGTPKAGVSAPNPDNPDDWDWSFPGPTFRIKVGDKVKIKLYNRLAPEEHANECNPLDVPTASPAGTPNPTPFPTDTFPECFHANNVTNLHFHGFHVDQGMRCDGKFGDDVFLALYPKGQPEHGMDHMKGIHDRIGEAEFEFDVPEGQARGTFWYHPHNHGSTDLQVSNGLSGMFIVEDTLNEHFDAAKPAEVVLVLQDIEETVKFGFGGANTPVPLVNGQVTPNIPMKAGEVQRWRLLNATGKGSNIYNIAFSGPANETPEIYLISADGIFLDTDQWDSEKPVDSIYLAPGNRVDFLVKARKEGSFSLGANSVQTKKPGSGGGGGGGGGNRKATVTAPADTLKTVPLVTTTVSGTQSPAMKLPKILPKRIDALRPIPDSEIAAYSTVKFSVVDSLKSGQAPIFQIDGKSFDPEFVGHKMVVDTAEEWTITNTTNVAHPFHIHLNPFFIKEFYDPNKGLPDPGRRWQDTLIIPPALFNADGSVNQPGKVVIRHRFPGIVDKFVLHCHILGHEDRGMMQVVEVVNKDGTPPGECDK